MALFSVSACSGGDDNDVPVLELAERGDGTCLLVEDDLPAEVERLPVVECDEPHTHEIYAVLPYEESDVFPGLEALESFAQARCFGAFKEFVGIEVIDSALYYSWLVPTLASWNNDNDRDVLCVLGDFQGGSMLGSMRDAQI